jgi:tRNA threonylcarbamoyladenosine biosynthesis protein TsaB
LRVACGVAQGLAAAHDIPVLPVIGLEAMALQSGAGRVVTLLDARMGEVYGACWANAAVGYALKGEIVVAAPQNLVLPDASGWMACGNAPVAYPALAERLAALGIPFIPGILPTASAIARLAAPRLAAGEGIDAAQLAPLYVRDKVAKTVAERLQEGGRA